MLFLLLNISLSFSAISFSVHLQEKVHSPFGDLLRILISQQVYCAFKTPFGSSTVSPLPLGSPSHSLPSEPGHHPTSARGSHGTPIRQTLICLLFSELFMVGHTSRMLISDWSHFVSKGTSYVSHAVL